MFRSIKIVVLSIIGAIFCAPLFPIIDTRTGDTLSWFYRPVNSVVIAMVGIIVLVVCINDIMKHEKKHSSSASLLAGFATNIAALPAESNFATRLGYLRQSLPMPTCNLWGMQIDADIMICGITLIGFMLLFSAAKTVDEKSEQPTTTALSQ